jgi:hypothetical protein
VAGTLFIVLSRSVSCADGGFHATEADRQSKVPDTNATNLSGK